MSNNEETDLSTLFERLNEAEPVIADARLVLEEFDGSAILSEQTKKFKSVVEEVLELSRQFNLEGNEEISMEKRLKIGNELIEKIPLMMVRITIHRASQSEKLALTFKNMLVFLLKLGDAVADILKEFKVGQNNDTKIPKKSREWAKIAGEILPYIVDAALATSNQKNQSLDRIINFLTRVKQLYPPEWWDQYLDTVGGGIIEDTIKFKTRIEDYQLTLGELTEEIGEIFGYVDNRM
ncbi:hypothetical protein GCK72_010926 [Caenorhabditis remanei]|uniref:Uncharacterized protein n=1 Tax=Caenorhabditis remanei TaxID=31234 RepID=A0A6A5H7A9_CAERE|nr:hypothetical protein GCK72_010926 [Caenorhabditis remanei]KAF1762664.1 hypothetical protein GCK72_010926 [Caenorhabditis remanei]